MSDNTISPDQRNRDRNRKRKALLAGGLVLGIGAAATLAAFTDGEFAKGTFSTGSFGIEGSTSHDTGFASHTDAEKAAGLTFSQAAEGLTPGDTVYASYFIKTNDDSLGGKLGDVTATKADNGLAHYLVPTVQYGTGNETCDEGFTGSATPVDLEAKGNNTIQACLAVKLNASQTDLEALESDARTGEIVWSWKATSA